VGVTAVVVTDHAVERARERLWPGLDLVAAEECLLRLLAEHGRVAKTVPDWVGTADFASYPDFWITIGADIACPVKDEGVVTTIVRSTRGRTKPRPARLDRRRRWGMRLRAEREKARNRRWRPDVEMAA
jgi:hypothetical protein